ncbi:MAG TPA: glycoside-pentoside-hexuronide (GPH):cation symporter, partial [Candidatus Saccharimonadales bacterium]|nr:glycoside-pentoside-hexuronide (GPH):cation symporter [Candidatus Saccharimonadales bacterium]
MILARLSPWEKIGYGLGDFGSNIVFQSILILLPVFYTDVFGLTPAAMGLLFLVVRLFDTVIDPVMGVVADNTVTRWGKYRPYLLWFAVPFALLFVLCYTTPDFSGSGKVIYAYATYGGLMVLYTVINIPYCALGGVITADSQERVSANSYRFVLATLAGVIIAYFGSKLVTYFGHGSQQSGYTWAMSVFGVLAIVSFVICFSLTRERITQVASTKGTLLLDIRTLVRNDQWFIVASLFFILLISVVLRSGSAAYYIRWFVKRPDLTAAFLAAGTLAQLAGASVASWFTKRMDKVPSYVLSQVVILSGSVGLYFVQDTNLFLIFALYIVINFFLQMGAPVLFTMAADSVEYGELKTGRRVTGLVFSGALFALKLGVAVGGCLIGVMLGHSGYDAHARTQSPGAISAIVLSVTL